MCRWVVYPHLHLAQPNNNNNNTQKTFRINSDFNAVCLPLHVYIDYIAYQNCKQQIYKKKTNALLCNARVYRNFKRWLVSRNAVSKVFKQLIKSSQPADLHV